MINEALPRPCDGARFVVARRLCYRFKIRGVIGNATPENAGKRPNFSTRARSQLAGAKLVSIKKHKRAQLDEQSVGTQERGEGITLLNGRQIGVRTVFVDRSSVD
jgi:hypothetical protein